MLTDISGTALYFKYSNDNDNSTDNNKDNNKIAFR